MALRAVYRNILGVRPQSYSCTLVFCRRISSEIPKEHENIFSKIEEENRAKILKLREKDLPTFSAEGNPFEREKPQCILCKLDITPDYKNVRFLSQFVSPYTGRIYGRHITGLCKHKQELVEKEILTSRNAGLMAYVLKDVSFVKDPKLYNPEKPIRPHRF